MNRPVGVTIIAVLQLIGAILVLIGSLGILIFKDAIGQELAQAPALSQDSSFITGFGVFLLGLAIVGFFLAYGLYHLKGWAWLTTLILQSLGILSNLTTLFTDGPNQGIAVFQIVVSSVVVYYLLRSEVKRAFGH
jgi:uncharacterized protein YhhL (DUF1145 family)